MMPSNSPDSALGNPSKHPYRASLLVLLYNCQIPDSNTLKSLIETNSNLLDCSLTIWNNGPAVIPANVDEFMHRFKFVEFTQTIENRSLSQIYNAFLKEEATRLVILDHDTLIDDAFLNNVLSLEDGLIGIPSIFSQGRLRSPFVNGVYHAGPYRSRDTLAAIGSGITLTHKALNLIKRKYSTPFDENFVLYGVDSTFFFRIQRLGLSSTVKVLGQLEHSISMFESESEETASFRKLERSYDLGLSLRYYPTTKLFVYVLKTILRASYSESLINPTIVFKALLSGKHYRAQPASNCLFNRGS